MLKIVRVQGQAVTMRSLNGRDWFSSPKAALDHSRQRKAEKEKLQREWKEQPFDYLIGVSEEALKCSIRL